MFQGIKLLRLGQCKRVVLSFEAIGLSDLSKVAKAADTSSVLSTLKQQNALGPCHFVFSSKLESADYMEEMHSISN